MPLQATSGAASYDAFGGGAAVAPKYIEDFFQTWLRTGTGASATVTTGLNASINKSLVWTKSRSAATNHKLTDTVRGATKALSSNTTSAEATDSQGLTAFSSTGYTIGTSADYNNSGATYVDWQLIAQPKFFDVVTYTGNGSARTIAHNLGSVPGCIIVKRTDTTGDWQVYHQSLGATKNIVLNSTSEATTTSTRWNDTAPTSSVFTIGVSNTVNNPGSTYVAYLFAHNAGGFGLTGTDNVISCGSYTGTSTVGNEINVGFEPQFIIIKRATGTAENWVMFDNMRGIATGGNDAILYPSGSFAEYDAGNYLGLTATGFKIEGSSLNVSGDTYIYIAIRRGPMKTPTDGTKVFSPNAVSTDSSAVTTNFPVDLSFESPRSGSSNISGWTEVLL